MTASSDECKPYLSGVLFHTPKVTPALLKGIRSALSALIVPSDGQTSGSARELESIEPSSGNHSGLVWTVLHYSEQRTPPWYLGSEVLDFSHHLIAIAGQGKTVSVSFSDNSTRNSVVKEIRSSSSTDNVLSKLKPFSATDMKNMLVADKVRTLWLSGIHRRSAVKADSKTLSGLELESAVDPLGDQTYFYSSIRSTISNAGLGKSGTNAVVGTSPAHSRFWVGPTEGWLDYLERITKLHEHLASNASAASPSPVLSMLAQPGASLNEVKDPYGVSLIVPEAQFPDAVIDGDLDWLQQFADTVRFDVVAKEGTANFNANIIWAGDRLGTLEFSFEEPANGKTNLISRVVDWKDDGETGSQILKICQDQSLLTIHFDTGHTFARGSLYSISFRDPRFNRWKFVGLDGIDITKEKPHRGTDRRKFASEKIGDTDDDSLFTFVVRHWPELQTSGSPSGWLVCDDGSMESADFIHIGKRDGEDCVSLIHVKGSGSANSGRQISVSDYEVVVGQAVKNLRYLDRSNLFDKLSGNKDGNLKDAVWHDGVRQQSREEVLKVVRALGSNYTVRVFIVQPRVMKSAWETNRQRIDGGHGDNSNTLRLRQLDALLQGASVDCYGLGAEFFVVGHDV
jgi:hypothetical protein